MLIIKKDSKNHEELIDLNQHFIWFYQISGLLKTMERVLQTGKMKNEKMAGRMLQFMMQAYYVMAPVTRIHIRILHG